MNNITKRTFTTAAVLAIVLFIGWVIYDRLLTSRFVLLYNYVSRHGGYLHSTGMTGTLWFWGILVGCLLLLLMVGLLQSKLPQTDTGAYDSETPKTVDVCPGCGMEVKSNWNLCPYCGYELP
jgi:hypothetical protein